MTVTYSTNPFNHLPRRILVVGPRKFVWVVAGRGPLRMRRLATGVELRTPWFSISTLASR